MAKPTAIRVAILWHMHQPDYREPHSNRLAMPWVRLHALKDYLDMPLNAGAFENVHVTFNLVPSLLDQLKLYTEGGSDSHLDLSRAPVEVLSSEQKLELLESFFAANPAQMINPFPRYRELYRKYNSGRSDRGALVSLFSSAEIRDLQVWSNLAWVDPIFRDEAPITALFAKGRHFSEEEKQVMLDWQLGLMRRVVPTYQKLQKEGRTEISFTPYYHPILPLLCDTNVATEALPSIKLPSERFVHPEDAENQIAKSVELYRELFGGDMPGMWPSEGSVSEEVLGIIARHGIKWVATDEEILSHSLAKSGLNPSDNPIHSVYKYGPGLKMLFRDHALSDRIGFVYSTWNADRAVADFVGHLKRLRSIYQNRLDRVVVPIILDGENAWEYFPDDATDFLRLFYQTLDEDPEIRTVTMSEAASEVEARPLPSVFAGSWINHSFRIWIGHAEDNAAWDLLKTTRDTVVRFQTEHPDYDREKIAAAWERIYVAEGSDWCWWYGDEHRGAHNEQFDRIFRQHLIAVYELLSLDIPFEHLKPIHIGGAGTQVVPPDTLVTPEIDGRVTHFYEWSGAGFFDCSLVGGSMHQVDRQVSGVYFAYDHDRFYIRLDFRSRKDLDLIAGLRVAVSFFVPELSIDFRLDEDSAVGGEEGKFSYALDDILEMAIERDYLWTEGFGALSFTVTLFERDQKIESWPEHEPVELEVPDRNRELFWPL